MMIAAPRKKARLDRVDAEAVKEMLESRGWKLFLGRLKILRDSKHSELEQRQSEIETATVRGYLDAIRAVASIPDILFREGNRVPDDEG